MVPQASSRWRLDKHTAGTLVGHLLIPLYLAAGMALAYVGAFHRAELNHLPVAVVGQGAATQQLATTIADRAGSQLEVRIVGDLARARAQVKSGRLVAAYVPDAAGKPPLVIIDSAAEPTSASVAHTLFQQVAATRGLSLGVRDVEPLPSWDVLGTNAFFLLVALTVGGYTTAAALGVAGAAAAIPYRLRSAFGVAASALIALVGTVVAGPIVGALHGHLVEVGLLAWLYVSTVVLVGSALHAFLGRYTTPALVTLFVMLNFTTSGGVYDARLQAGFFDALSRVWNGSAFLSATRGILYRDGTGVARGLDVLGCWLAVGIAAQLAAALVTSRRSAGAPDHITRETAELDENVAT